MTTDRMRTATSSIGVAARRHEPGHVRQHATGAGVGAALLDDVEPVAGDGAVAVAGEAGVLHLTAALDHADQVLGAGLGPAHRPAEAPGEPG